MQETLVQFLGWEVPLEEHMATHSSILAWRIFMDRGAWQATVHGVTKSRTRLSDFAFTFTFTLVSSAYLVIVEALEENDFSGRTC